MKMSRISVAVAAFLAGSAALACEIPSMIMIPADEQARQREAEHVRAEAEAYLNGMSAYAQCIRAELDAAGGEEAPPMLRSLLVQRNNLAAAESEAVMNWFKEAFGEGDANSAGAGDAAAEQDHERRSRRRDRE